MIKSTALAILLLIGASPTFAEEQSHSPEKVTKADLEQIFSSVNEAQRRGDYRTMARYLTDVTEENPILRTRPLPSSYEVVGMEIGPGDMTATLRVRAKFADSIGDKLAQAFGGPHDSVSEGQVVFKRRHGGWQIDQETWTPTSE